MRPDPNEGQEGNNKAGENFRRLLDEAIATHLAFDPFNNEDVPIELFTASQRSLIALLDLKHGRISRCQV